MIINKVIEKINLMEGNHYRNNGDIYITPKNMNYFISYFESMNDIQAMLFTPYLINENEGALYELHYYEFEIEIVENNESHYLEYNTNNSLPKEITTNLKPKAFVEKNDKIFLINSFQNYLQNMKKMNFEQERKSFKGLESAYLYFQVF